MYANINYSVLLSGACFVILRVAEFIHALFFNRREHRIVLYMRFFELNSKENSAVWKSVFDVLKLYIFLLNLLRIYLICM